MNCSELAAALDVCPGGAVRYTADQRSFRGSVHVRLVLAERLRFLPRPGMSGAAATDQPLDLVLELLVEPSTMLVTASRYS